ncbi:queuine tRNA-ribosyltransferase [Culex quinquefasciatus]|uniref:Queuine tRNA-ribosyltransferase n=1 Tax=Culex quinquefasciatus TaxID=7176 RepID=B0XEP6_CULQU|nr:queuine tRNA-ribosyltransferase [Culex quinquefasciatus]|eukprot:XP_001868118.1 queuine tRNA-ribosyltransferase [Culex quinquefasciatus]
MEWHRKWCQPVAVFVRSGQENFIAGSYMGLVEAIRTDISVPLIDSDTDEESWRKRGQRSLEWTGTFVEQCLKVHPESGKLKGASVLGPIRRTDAGGRLKDALQDSLRRLQ